jgi:S1-C subfamily serine protease
VPRPLLLGLVAAMLCMVAAAILLALHGEGARRESASQRLGMTFELAADAAAPLLVTSLRDDGPAGRAGLRVGDRIARINGAPTDSLRQDRERLDHAAAVHLAITRDGQPMAVTIAMVDSAGR